MGQGLVDRTVMMTRRGLVVPVLAGLVATACAPLLSTPETALGPPGWREVTAQYGTDPRQNLTLYRPPNRATALVLILSDPQPTEVDRSFARLITEQGMVAAVVGRRSSPVTAFPAYTADAARALAFVQERAGAIGIEPDRIGVLGINHGGHTALMLARDGRYLAAQGMTGHLAYVAVAALKPSVDETLTHPSAYPGTPAGPRVWKGEEFEIQQAIHLLKQELN